MVPWVAQGERVLRHRFPNWLGEMKAVSRMSAGVLGMGIRRLEQCVRKTRGRQEREAFRFLLLFAGAVRDRPATLRRQLLVQGGLMRAVRGKRGVGAGRRRRRRVYWRRRVRREEASAREARERQLQQHLQLLRRRARVWARQGEGVPAAAQGVFSGGRQGWAAVGRKGGEVLVGSGSGAAWRYAGCLLRLSRGLIRCDSPACYIQLILPLADHW